LIEDSLFDSFFHFSLIKSTGLLFLFFFFPVNQSTKGHRKRGSLPNHSKATEACHCHEKTTQAQGARSTRVLKYLSRIDRVPFSAIPSPRSSINKHGTANPLAPDDDGGFATTAGPCSISRPTKPLPPKASNAINPTSARTTRLAR